MQVLMENGLASASQNEPHTLAGSVKLSRELVIQALTKAVGGKGHLERCNLGVTCNARHGLELICQYAGERAAGGWGIHFTHWDACPKVFGQPSQRSQSLLCGMLWCSARAPPLAGP
jgi:hypothetical protein